MGGHHACNETPPSLILTPSLVPFSRPPGDADARNGAPRSVPLMELLISLDQGSLVDELQAEREVRARLERDWSEIGSRSERDRNEIGEPFHTAGHPAGLPEDHPDRAPPIAPPRLRPSSSLMTTLSAPLIIRWTWIYRPSQQRPVGNYHRPRPWRRRRRRRPSCSVHTAPRSLKSSPHAASSYYSSRAR
jgi:hypothetical protein